jgi:hypothetical protein
MKQIIIVKPGTLLADQLEKLQKEEGVIIIEHPEPSEIRIISTLEGFGGDDILQAFVSTIQNSGYTTKAEFATELVKRMKPKAENS